MNVRVCGPNLNDQSEGSFHVHATNCGDLKHYGPGRKYGGDCPGEQEMLITDATVTKVIEEVYGDILDENESDPDYIETLKSDFHFAPCCTGL